MKLRNTGLVVLAAMMLVVGLATSALAIEAFQMPPARLPIRRAAGLADSGVD